MTDKLVPYLTPSTRTWRLGIALVLVMSAAIAGRAVFGPQPAAIIAVIALAVVAFIFAAKVLDARFARAFVSPEELERRYASETAARPLWIGALIRSLGFVPTIPVLIGALRPEPWMSDLWQIVWFLIWFTPAMFPFVLFAGFALARSDRARAREHLARAAGDHVATAE